MEKSTFEESVRLVGPYILKKAQTSEGQYVFKNVTYYYLLSQINNTYFILLFILILTLI